MTTIGELAIRLWVDDAGREQVNIVGPITNKVLCYGMLERAKDAVREFDPTKASGLVVPQNGNRLVP